MNITPLRPLICPSTVYDLSNIASSEALLRLIDSGDISMAFDVRSPRATKATIRVYWPAFLDFIEKRKRDLDLDTAIRSIIGEPRDTIALDFFARAIKCSVLHVSNLARRGKLKAVSKSRCGPGGSKKLCWKSAAAFLRSARIL